MKKITAFLLIAVLLFSIGIITSCSGESKKSEETTSIAKTEAVTEAQTESEFDSMTALDRAIEYLVDVDGELNSSAIENNISYKMIPSKDKSIFFMRYNFGDLIDGDGVINNDDLLIFKSGKIISLKNDESGFKKYNNKFSIKIVGIKDEDILKQPDCVNGG